MNFTHAHYVYSSLSSDSGVVGFVYNFERCGLLYMHTLLMLLNNYNPGEINVCLIIQQVLVSMVGSL